MGDDIGRLPAEEAPSPEDPNRFSGDAVAPLDEAPGGHTPAEPTESGTDSLPPGASQKPD
jgi:hypothetical protein